MRQGGGLMSQGEQTMLALRVRLDLDALLRGRAAWALDDLAGALNVAQLLAEQRQKSLLPIVRRAQDEVLRAHARLLDGLDPERPDSDGAETLVRSVELYESALRFRPRLELARLFAEVLRRLESGRVARVVRAPGPQPVPV